MNSGHQNKLWRRIGLQLGCGHQGLWAGAAALLVLGFFSLPLSLGLHNTSYALAGVLAWFGFIPWLKNGEWRQWLADPLVRWLLLLLPILLWGSWHSLADWQGELGASFKKYVKFPLAAVLLLLLRKPLLQRQASWGFGLGAALVTAISYLNFFWDIPWLPSREQEWGDQTVVGNYITQGIMLSFLVLLCLQRLRASGTGWQRWVWSAGALLAIGAVAYLLNGRTGYVALLAGLLGYGLFALPRKWLALAFTSSQRVQERYVLAKQETQQVFQELQQGQTPTFSSIGARWYMWLKTTEIIRDKPITGWGLGSHGIQWCERNPQPEWCYVGRYTPHNQFLFFASELGLLGVIWFIGLFFILARAGWKNPAMRPLMMGFLGIFLIDSLFNASLWNAREYNFFLIMLCLLYAKAQAPSQTEGIPHRQRRVV